MDSPLSKERWLCEPCCCEFATFEDFHQHLYWHDSNGLIGKPASVRAKTAAEEAL